MFPSAISFFFPLLLLLYSHAEAQSGVFANFQCDYSSNFTANSTFESNLDRLLLNLSSNGYASGFLQDTEGQVPDQVYGVALCQGDIDPTTCRSCLESASRDAQKYCPHNKVSLLWYDICFVGYSYKRSLLSNTDINPWYWYEENPDNATQPDRFEYLLDLLLNSTADLTANSSKRFATAEVSTYTSDIPIIYGMMQCKPSMSVSECSQCLRVMFQPSLVKALIGKLGGREIGIYCGLRYGTSSFYGSPSTAKITAPPPPKNATEPSAAPAAPPGAARPAGFDEDRGKKNTARIALGVALPGVTIILISIIFCICLSRRRPKSQPSDEMESKNNSNFESIKFDKSTLIVATANFSEMNKLGEGGFGAVYKGLLPNGQGIAVKRLLNLGHGLGELTNELVLVAKLQHRNLVRLLGFCSEEKMIVYEYVPNRSLDTFLFDPVRRGGLQWGTRYKIICGIARGLLYLHEESQLRIVHRDLKPNNILLDSFMNPKISDFGLAKLFDDDQSQGTTRRVMGTYGYMAPEYAMQGMFSTKSDVFSFGVVVLEILTGRRITANYDSHIRENLMSFTWGNWKRGTTMEIVDPALNGKYQGGDVLRCIQIGLLCVQEDPLDRPTMRMVDLMLSSESITIQLPSKPAFCVETSGHEREVSNNEVSMSELAPR